MPLLCIMMFFQFFLWGSWYVTAGAELGARGFDGAQIGWTYSVGPIAGMLSPFFLGMVADRFFPTQRILGVLHLVGAGAMYMAMQSLDAEVISPTTTNAWFFAHMLCYYPTLSLTATLALHHLTDTEKQFPLVRVFGTIGWIAAGFALSWQSWDSGLGMFRLAAITGVVMGIYCFFLPHTPPPLKGTEASMRQVMGLDALKLLKDRNFLVFMLCSFLICIPLAFYYQFAERTLRAGGLTDTATKMSFGQMSEIFFMVLMPLFFVRLGVKKMLAIGMACWALRYFLFMFGMPDGVTWMLLSGVILHGICYDFFFVTGQIYTDQVAGKALRGQAQGLLVFFTIGLGMFVGAMVAGKTEVHFTDEPARLVQVERITELDNQISQLQMQSGEEATASLQADRVAAQRVLLNTTDWSSIYKWPAYGALAVMLLFLVLFRDPKKRRDTHEGLTETAD